MNSDSVSVELEKPSRLDMLRGIAGDAHLRQTALTLVSVSCAIASIVAATFLAITGLSPLFGVLVLLQIALIACVVGARRSMSRHLAALTRLVESDPATGCLNRRGFARAFDEALLSAVVARNDVALLALDVDHFKQINDKYGHNVGDLVLAELAHILAETVGSAGVVARLGGEEFTVLLPGADAEDAGVMAERLLERLRSECCGSLAPGTIVTMSIGIATERIASVRDGAALRARSDEALYMAKREGRDRALLWAPGVRSLATPAAAMAVITTQPRWTATR